MTPIAWVRSFETLWPQRRRDAENQNAPRRLIYRLALLFLLLSNVIACAPPEFVGARSAPCRLPSGASSRVVLQFCGVRDGLRYQPKIAEGLLSPRLCSAPVYVYQHAMVGFGCSGHVNEVLVGEPPTPLGIEIGVESLQQELTQKQNVEAALIGL